LFVFCYPTNKNESSNLFSIGKYPFFIYKIGLKNIARKKKKSLDFSRLFVAISFLSPFFGESSRDLNYAPLRAMKSYGFQRCALCCVRTQRSRSNLRRLA
jgi:hypothetical protein